VTERDLQHPNHGEYLKRKRNYYQTNQPRMREIQRVWRAANRDRINASKREERRKNLAQAREYFRVKGKEWRSANPARCRELARQFYWRHREQILKKCKVARLAIRLEAFEKYGGTQCRCCGENLVEFLSLDHINNNGAADRRSGSRSGHVLYEKLKRAGWPSGYQVLCYNCNCAKGFFGECPHQRERAIRVRGAEI
jgi:hypothetical protein